MIMHYMSTFCRPVQAHPWGPHAPLARVRERGWGRGWFLNPPAIHLNRRCVLEARCHERPVADEQGVGRRGVIGAAFDQLAGERLIDAFLEAAGKQSTANVAVVVAIALAAAVEFQQHAAQRRGAQGVRGPVQHFGFKPFHVDFEHERRASGQGFVQGSHGDGFGSGAVRWMGDDVIDGIAIGGERHVARPGAHGLLMQLGPVGDAIEPDVALQPGEGGRTRFEGEACSASASGGQHGVGANVSPDIDE